MNESIRVLKENKQEILDKWMNNQSMEEGFRNEIFLSDQRSESEELLTALLSSLNEESIANAASTQFDNVQDILSAISISRGKQGFSTRETNGYLIALKEAILEVLSEQNIVHAESYKNVLQISRIFDQFGMTTIEAFIRGREEVILRQSDEIAEISTPVIRVWDGILALPIIGTLDSSRTQIVMESLLQEIVETGSPIAILDISGVPAVDSLVAQHLIKTVGATRLMGAECIISGIRPEIAQTVVHLGIDLSDIITKATLASALKTAFQMLQLQVINSHKSNTAR